MLPSSGPAPQTQTPERSGLIVSPNHTPRILIVEDEPFIALMIEEMIEELGYQVAGTAHTMAIAGQEFAKRNYDLVLLDLNMGGQYHAATADHLLGWNVPFAFVTGYDYLVEPRHQDIPVLQKPFELDDLRALLKDLLRPESARLAQAG